MALYDLLLQGGRTYDPETRTFAREDVAVREGKIVLRAGEIPAPPRCWTPRGVWYPRG